MAAPFSRLKPMLFISVAILRLECIFDYQEQFMNQIILSKKKIIKQIESKIF
jgi:hypothetical protein